LIGGHVVERLHRAGGPADLDFVNAGGLGQAKGQDQFVLRGITGTTGHFMALPGSPRLQTNPGANGGAVAPSSFQSESQIVVTDLGVIARM